MQPSDLIKPGDETVTALFPNKVKLNLDGAIVDFPEGIVEIPKNLIGHWYLKAHGVKIYDKPIYPKETPFAAVDDHLEFLKSRGYENLTSLADVNKFIGGLDSSSRETFLKDFSLWKDEKEGKGKGKLSLPDFATMNKDKLVAWAKEALGLELDARTNRADIIKAIEQKIEEPEAQEGE